MSNESQDLITKAELCARLCRTARTIENWVRDHILPDPIKVRRSIYFYWSEVLAYLDKYFGPRGPHRKPALRPPPPPPPHGKRKPRAKAPDAPNPTEPTPGRSAPPDSNKRKRDGEDPAPPQEGGDSKAKP